MEPAKESCLEAFFSIAQDGRSIDPERKTSAFVRFATALPSMELNGVTLDLLDEDHIVSFMIKLCRECFCSDISQEPCAVGVHSGLLVPLVTYLRTRATHHQARIYPSLRQWDQNFAEVLVYYVFRSNPEPTWKRLFKYILMNDTIRPPNFDGGDGIVRAIKSMVQKLCDTVCQETAQGLRQEILEANKLSAWVQPRCVAIAHLNGWSLLHLSAAQPSLSAETYKMLITEIGCDVTVCDEIGQTALHVAAATLNHPAVTELSRASNRAVRTADHRGRLPVDLLLHSISLCDWRRRVSSLKLQEMLFALVPPGASDWWWARRYTPPDDLATCAAHRKESIRSAPFFAAVAHVDDFVAEEVVRQARSSPPSVWDKAVVREAVYHCIRSVTNRAATVDLLIREFPELVEADKEDASEEGGMLSFLDTCLCHALVTAGRHGKPDRPVLLVLLNQASRAMEALCPVDPASGAGDGACEVQPMVFVYLAVARRDAALLPLVLSALPRTAVRSLLYQTVDPSPHFVERWQYFVRAEIGPEGAKEQPRCQVTSPLSLACVIGDVGVLNALLRAGYSAPPRRTASDTMDDVQRSQREHYLPALACVQHGRSECLRVVRNLFTQEAFYHLCFVMKDAATAQCTVFQSLLVAISGVSAGVHPPLHNHKRAEVKDLRGYADCLKLLLDSIPAGYTPPVLAGWCEDSGAQEQASAGPQVVLQEQLESVQQAMARLCEKSDQHRAYFTARRDAAVEIGDEIAAIGGDVLSRWQAHRKRSDDIVAQIEKPSFLTNIRLLAKSFTPDKKWVKLAYCFGRLLLALGLELPFSPPNDLKSASSSGAFPEVVDGSSWDAFVSMLSRLCRGTGQLTSFAATLAATLGEVFAPTTSRASLDNSSSGVADRLLSGTEELLVIERVLADNQLVVLLRTKSGPSPVPDDAPLVPHYQVNDIRPDVRSQSLYATLHSWVVAMLEAAKLREDLTISTMPGQPENDVKVTMLDYILHRQLCAEERRLQNLLALCSAEDLDPSPTALSLLLGEGGRPPAECGADVAIRALTQAGIAPNDAAPAPKREQSKQKNLKVLEQMACVLVEYNERLGGQPDDLVPCILPLCVREMWKAAETTLKLLLKHTSKLHGDCIMRCLSHVTTAPSRCATAVKAAMTQFSLALGEKGANHDAAARAKSDEHAVPGGEFVVLTPLHYAVVDGQKGFVEPFLRVFHSAAIDLLDVVDFACDLHASEMALTVVAHSVHCQSVSFASLSCPVLGYSKDNVCFGNELRMVQSASIKACSKRLARAAKFRQLLISAMREAQQQPAAAITTSHTSEGSEVFIMRTDPVTEVQYVRLMDGTEVPWAVAVDDAALLALALPAPQRAGGLLGSGCTVLHEACRRGDMDGVVELMRRDPAWREKVFMVNWRGLTPVTIVAQQGYLSLAHYLLSHVTASESSSPEDLYVRHSSAGREARTSACNSIVARAERQLRQLEEQFRVAPIPRTHSLQQFKLRSFKVENCTQALSWYMSHIERLWKQICSSDPKSLLQVLQLPACAQLDSVIRARQALALIGIPLSQLVVTKPDSSTTRALPVKEFDALCPGKLRKLVSAPTAAQLRNLISGWFRLRSAAPPSALDDCLFLYRNSDASIVEIGRSGMEASRYLRLHAAYVRACDRVAAKGINASHTIHTFGTLCDQLKLEMRFDVTSASKENVLRQGRLGLLDRLEATSPRGWESKVNGLLQTMQIDSASCAQTLDLACLVLEFSRAVCVARQLVSITSEPNSSDTTGAQQHPLDRLHSQIVATRERVQHLRAMFSPKDKSSLTLGGIRSPLNICTLLSSAQLDSFLTTKSEVSTRFDGLRSILVQGMAHLLHDHGELQLSEFVCRAGKLEATKGAAAESTPSLEQGSAEPTKVGNTSSAKFNQISDAAAGLTRLHKWLQSLQLKDLLDGGHSSLQVFAAQYNTALSELLKSGRDKFEFCPGEIIVPTDTPAQEIKPVVFTASSLALQRSQEREAVRHTAALEAQLREAYAAAKILHKVISAAIYAPQVKDLYAGDLCALIHAAHAVDPLLALCKPPVEPHSPSATTSKRRILVQPPSKREKTERHRLQLECCEKLLQFGFDPLKADDVGSSAVAVAAMTGYVTVLQACLQRIPSGKLRTAAHLQTLLWHVLLEGSSQKDGACHLACAQLLLEHGIFAGHPEGCDHSALEVALMMQAPQEVLEALVQRRVPMTVASAHRALRWLLLRETSAPLSVLDAILFACSDNLSDLLNNHTSVFEDMRSAEFDRVVTQEGSEYRQKIIGSNVKGTSIARSLVHPLRALNVARKKRLGVKIGKPTTAALNATVAHLEGEDQGEVSKVPVCLLCCIAESAQASVVTALIRALTPHMHKALFVEEDGKVVFTTAAEAHAPHVHVALVDLVCTACAHSNLAAIEAMEKLYIAWRVSGPIDADAADHASVEGKVDEPITEVAKLAAKGPSWDELLNSAGKCLGSDRASTPLEMSLAGHAAECVEYLCERPGVRVLCSLAVAAIARGQLKERTLLSLLQRALPSATDTDTVCLEYDSLPAFLSATEHTDMAGEAVISGETLLHVCCRRNFPMLVRHLLSVSADPLVEDANGCTALQCSVAAGARSVTRLLYKACPERVQKAVQVLSYAVRKALLRRFARKVVTN